MGSFCPLSQNMYSCYSHSKWVLAAFVASSKFRSFQNCTEVKYIGNVIDPSSRDLTALQNSDVVAHWFCVAWCDEL